MDPRKAVQLKLVADSPVPPRALEEQTDDDLMLLTRAGEQAAFQVLVRRHQGRILRVAARYLRDRSWATDVAQNAFLEMYRSRHRYKRCGKFIPYLCRITLNQCRMSARSARNHARLIEADIEELTTTDVILQRERRRDLEAALAQLSEKLRVVVILQYAGDLQQSEIAAALQIPVGTVKRRLFDAMAKLRVLLEEPI